jgi:hypothetical protein
MWRLVLLAETGIQALFGLKRREAFAARFASGVLEQSSRTSRRWDYRRIRGDQQPRTDGEADRYCAICHSRTAE